MRILFGVSGNYESNIECKIQETYKNVVGETFDYDCEYYSEGIKKVLDEVHYNVLVLRDNIDGTGIVNIETIEEITDKYSDLKIIYLISNSDENYLKAIYRTGLTNVIYEKDADITEIVKLMIKGRTKQEAKSYLELDDEIPDVSANYTQEIPEEELDQLLSDLSSSENSKLCERFEEAYFKYTDKQVLYLMTLLPEVTLNVLKTLKSKNFMKIYKRYTEIKKNYIEMKDATVNVTDQISEHKILNKKEEGDASEVRIITKIERKQFILDLKKIQDLVLKTKTRLINLVKYVGSI